MSEHKEGAAAPAPDVANLIDDLRSHMIAEGELDAEGAAAPIEADLDGTYVLEQKAKLVVMAGADQAFLVPSGQDWAHDTLGDARVIPGTLYGDGDPFLEGDAAVSGYFQADEDGRWVRVHRGHAAADGWRDGLDEFPEVLAELQESMDVSVYRHVVEQATMKTLVEGQ